MRKVNKKAKYNYKIIERYEAGIVLSGAEVKAVKRGNINLAASYAKIIKGEAYLINASISVESKKDHDPRRTRKLLLRKDQIISIQSKIKGKKLTLVPILVYTKGRLVKVKVALAKPKRKFEKREVKKKKDIEREIQRELKNY